MNPDLRCYHHPECEATSQCDRCGDYLCGDCVNEHDELHVCARCLKDIKPRVEIGMSAKIACIMNALACSNWLLLLIYAKRQWSGPPFFLSSAEDGLVSMSKTVSALAVLIVLSGMRGRASEEHYFRWSVATSASGSALFIAVFLFGLYNISYIGSMLMCSSWFILQLISVALLGAAAWKRARPIWALVVALLAPLMFGYFLFIKFYNLVLFFQY